MKKKDTVLGKVLRDARKRSGRNRKWISEFTGLSPTMLFYYESGQILPSSEYYLCLLMAAYELSSGEVGAVIDSYCTEKTTFTPEVIKSLFAQFRVSQK